MYIWAEGKASVKALGQETVSAGAERASEQGRSVGQVRGGWGGGLGQAGGGGWGGDAPGLGMGGHLQQGANLAPWGLLPMALPARAGLPSSPPGETAYLFRKKC